MEIYEALVIIAAFVWFLFTCFVLRAVSLSGRVTGARFLTGVGAWIIVGGAIAVFLWVKGLDDWGTLVGGLALYMGVHTYRSVTENKLFRGMVIGWVVLILARTVTFDGGPLLAVSLTSACFVDYLLALYEKWLTGNPNKANYESRKEEINTNTGDAHSANFFKWFFGYITFRNFVQEVIRSEKDRKIAIKKIPKP